MTESEVESRLIGLMADNLARVRRAEDVERLAIELGAANGLPAVAVAAVAERIRRQFERQFDAAGSTEKSPTAFPRLRVDWGQNLTVGRQVCPQFHVLCPPEFAGRPEVEILIDDRLDHPAGGHRPSVARDVDGLWEFDVPFGLTTHGNDCRPGRYKLEVRLAFPATNAPLPRFFLCRIYLNILHPDETHGPTLEIEGDGQSIVNLHGGELNRFSTVRLKGGDRAVVNVQDVQNSGAHAAPSKQIPGISEDSRDSGRFATCEYVFRIDDRRQQHRPAVQHDVPRQRMESAMLVPEPGTGPRILIIPRQTVHLGRARENDIVTRFLPRSEEHDRLSKEISRVHCRIRLTDDGLCIEDLGSTRGTALEHRRLNPDRVLDHTQIEEDLELDLAADLGRDAFRLLLRLFSETAELTEPARRDESYAEALGLGSVPRLWRRAATAGIDAALLCRRKTLVGEEDYLLLFRRAVIGSAASAAIRLHGPSVARSHARLLHLDGCFWLENLAAESRTLVNGSALPPQTLFPLADGSVLTFGDQTLQFTAAAQIEF
jgi:pSer/pThr/pTyr-binding forkhead associated (FHA) protein